MPLHRRIFVTSRWLDRQSRRQHRGHHAAVQKLAQRRDTVAWSRGYLFIGLAVAASGALTVACGPSGQDQRDQLRVLAQQTCEDAIRDQLASRATAQFSSDAEHVYYDSLGGAGVTGTVTTASGQRNFACLLKPTADSSWTLTAARLLN
jgi:hypothetical protein